MTSDVMAAYAWKSNAHMLADLFDVMGRPSGPWVDLTFGEKGAWWNAPNIAPDDLVRCVGPDTATTRDDVVRTDFRATPFASNTFGLTCFDPPYVLKGGAGKFDDMNRRYGVGAELTERRGERSRKEALFDLVEDGLTEAARITRPGGWVLAKAGRGIDGGKLVRTDDLMVRTGEDMGLTVLTTLLLLSRPRSQAHRGPQKTPRANFSTLIVFEVP